MHRFALQFRSPAMRRDLRTCFSANTFVKLFNTLTGFTNRGLSPHKPFDLEPFGCELKAERLRAERFTPMPVKDPVSVGVYKANSTDTESRAADGGAGYPSHNQPGFSS